MDTKIDGTTGGRIILPGGGTCDRVIDLASGGEPEVGEVLHLTGVPGLPALRARFLVGEQVVIGCPDCSGLPELIPSGEGFTVSLLILHDWSCPLYHGTLRDLRERGAL